MAAANVHASSIERMLEQLCRIRVDPLRCAIRERGQSFSIDPRAEHPPHRGGVYAYWWVGGHAKLRDAHRQVELHGPGGRPVAIEIHDEWLGLDTDLPELPIPLYVGKTAGSIRKRMGQHLMLGRMGKVIEPSLQKGKAPTTSCQVRAGIERLFPDEPNPVHLLRDNLGLSFVELDDDRHAANRFYLESLAIGRMRPVLNLDIER